jgi:hypothetical protein
MVILVFCSTGLYMTSKAAVLSRRQPGRTYNKTARSGAGGAVAHTLFEHGRRLHLALDTCQASTCR